MSEPIKQRYDDIRKSLCDSRNYRGLKLSNDLTVLLINDPNTDISAASLSVAVGSLSNPKNIPGLAHLCEHVLSMGTKKYPEENEFSQFIIQNGGNYTAYTAMDHTNYHCSSNTDSLGPLLDRFSRFFSEPLFAPSTVEREINAVNSEHEKNKAIDSWRLEQLKRSMADPNHPFNMFTTGTKQTLWDIPIKNKLYVFEKLQEFHSNHYSSHLMYLAVLGKEDLNTLEDMVSSLFVHIERKDIEMPIWVDKIYKKEQLATKTIVVPVKDVRKLCIDFLINDQQPNYKSKPTEYLNAIFSHTSISAILCMRGWANEFSACSVFEARGIEYYEITMDLTEIGLNYVDAIIKVIFQFVNMLKLRGPQEWFHEETKLINALEFQYKDNESPLNYVTMLTPQMIRYNLNDVLIAEHLIEEWKPDLITELLSYFRPDNMRVTVISKKFQDQTNTQDEYYGTPFAVSKIPMETINFWLEDDICEGIIMPSKNKYVASNFTLVPIEIHKEPKIPKIFYNSSILRCWLKIDTEFRLPKAFVSVDFFSPIVAVDPFNYNIMDIFVKLFIEDFFKHIYNASRANLHLILKSRIHGFNFILHGFNQKINKLLKKIIERLLTFTIDSQRLEIIKEEKIRKLKNIETENPYRSVMHYSSMILSETSWSPRELLKSIDGIDVDSVRDFMNNFWSHLYIESLMYGNLDRRMAVILIDILEKPFLSLKGFRPLSSRELIRSREVEIDDGENTLYERTTEFHSCSGVQVNLQCGQCDVRNIKNNVVVSLFNQIIEESCYNVLRTQEQLGYVVTSITRKSNGVVYFCIIVQSDYNPIFVHTRIEHYLSTVESLLNNLTDEEFLKHKESLATKLLEKPKGMIEQAVVYRSEIIDQCYIFKTGEVEVKVLTSITKEDIIEFYQQKINLTGPKRRMLSVYIRSTLNQKSNECSTLSSSDINLFITSKLQKIDDINEFKKSHQLYPAPGKFIVRQPRHVSIAKKHIIPISSE